MDLSNIFGTSAEKIDVSGHTDINAKIDPADMKEYQGMKAMQLIGMKGQGVPLNKNEQGFLNGEKIGTDNINNDIRRSVNDIRQASEEEYRFDHGKSSISKDDIKNKYARELDVSARDRVGSYLLDQPTAASPKPEAAKSSSPSTPGF